MMPPRSGGDPGRRLRVLTYSHDGYGIGHLRRNLRLASRLVTRFPMTSVLAATGSRVAHCFELPDKVDYFKLPSVTKLANDEYAADGLQLAATEVSELRAGLLEAAVRHYSPDLVLVDRYPLGVSGELVPALDELRRHHPGTKVVLGLRDILDAPEVIRDEWRRKRHTEAITDHYDLVLVYGDPRVYNPVAEYQLPEAVASRVAFTGYLAEQDAGGTGARLRARLDRGSSRLAVCTVGGGKDAAHVTWAFLAALETMCHEGWTGVLITGPFVDDRELLRIMAAAAPLGVAVHRFIDDLPAHLAVADVVVSMGGYNTMCETLAQGAPTVVVPRITPRVEQLIRASRFADRGAVELLHPDRLTAATLRDAMRRRAEVPRPEIRSAIDAAFDLDGLDRAADAVTSTLGYAVAVA